MKSSCPHRRQENIWPWRAEALRANKTDKEMRVQQPIKKLPFNIRHLHKQFPNLLEPEFFVWGAQGVALRTKNGQIIRQKFLRRGYRSYAQEARLLDFIRRAGGIGCSTPHLNTFVRLPFAYSVHQEISGNIFDYARFTQLPVQQQTRFATELAEALIKLRDLAQTDAALEAKSLFTQPKQFGLFRHWRYFLVLRQYVHRKNLWQQYVDLWRAVVENRREGRQASSYGLVHNDLHFANIIVNEEFHLSGLIDFEKIFLTSFEYNLRGIGPSLRNLISAHYEQTQVQPLNNKLIHYYRMMSILRILKHMHKRKHRNKPPKDIRPLIEELESFFD